MAMQFKTIFLVMFFLAVGNVFAQDINQSSALPSSVSLSAEIQNLEKTAAQQGISAIERHNALVRLARLHQLSGNIETAARNWLEAAGAIPGSVDDEALLACAYCLAAMGEWDRAAAALEPLLSKNIRARFLNTGINAIRTGDTTALIAIVDNPNYSEMKSEILFLLWKISNEQLADEWRLRLKNEFPNSPEGRLAAELNPAVLMPTPFWFFISGFDSDTLLAGGALPVPPVVIPVENPPVQIRLQTGVFGREVNAQSQAANLRNVGFSPTIERRFVNNNEMWAVTVPAGSDVNSTINSLRTAGFEAFVVR
ncbi:MAG: SPOR domain-containing protein [Treponema sp.]|jgi:tetratricopeptide (TPR) repeat protein|nr:SPOR domain-containing protein [Treponema sp.]